MAQVPLSPPPPTGGILDGWLYLLWRRLVQEGQIFWNVVIKTGSNLTDIETRNHNDLQNLDAGDYKHFTAANYTDLTDAGDSALHYHSTDRNSANFTGTNWTDLTDAGDSALHYHATDRARANHTGTQSISTLSDLPTLDASTYTPALTNVTNLDASTAYSCQYIRVGSVVTVSGVVDADPTAAGLVQLGIALPIASNFANANECAGTAAATGIAGQSAGIVADATNDRAEMKWIAVDTTNQPMAFSFTYRII